MSNRSLITITLIGMLLTGIGAGLEAQGQGHRQFNRDGLNRAGLHRPGYGRPFNNQRRAAYVQRVNPQDTAGKALVRTVIGAGIGAGTGAIIGGRRGALIGATAGAVGGLIYHEAKVSAQRNRRRGW